MDLYIVIWFYCWLAYILLYGYIVNITYILLYGPYC